MQHLTYLKGLRWELGVHQTVGGSKHGFSGDIWKSGRIWMSDREVIGSSRMFEEISTLAAYLQKCEREKGYISTLAELGIRSPTAELLPFTLL